MKIIKKFLDNIQGKIEDFQSTNILYNTFTLKNKKLYFIETTRGYFIFNNSYDYAKFQKKCQNMWSAGYCETTEECYIFFQEIERDNDKIFFI